MSVFNLFHRGTLLAFSMLCVAFTIFLMFYVYKYRQLKIFRIASPIFLCLTLIGCAVMYLEVSCIPWLGDMGFGLASGRSRVRSCAQREIYFLDAACSCTYWDTFFSCRWQRYFLSLTYTHVYLRSGHAILGSASHTLLSWWKHGGNSSNLNQAMRWSVRTTSKCTNIFIILYKCVPLDLLKLIFKNYIWFLSKMYIQIYEILPIITNCSFFLHAGFRWHTG